MVYTAVLWCSQLESPGTSLEVFSMKYCGTTWSNMVFWTPDNESSVLQAEPFQKNLVEIELTTLLAVFGQFCMGVLCTMEGS
jgi:hypothetical protein